MKQAGILRRSAKWSLTDYADRTENAECWVFWVTARDIYMTMPGGVLIMGQLFDDPPNGQPNITRFVRNSTWSEKMDNEIENDFGKNFANAVKIKKHNPHGEPLNKLTPRVIRMKMPWNNPAYVVHAFTEEEAALVAYEHGIRSQAREGDWQYRWTGLEKIQKQRQR